MNRPAIKGTAFLARYAFVEQTFGQEGLKKVCSRLPERERKAFELPDATEWYPADEVLAVDRVMVSELFGGDKKRMSEVGRFAIEARVNTFYRFLFRVLNTETMLKNGMLVFQKSVKEAAIKVETKGPKDLVVRFDGFNPVEETYCHFNQGAVEAVLSLSGVTRASVSKASCVLHGQEACTYKVQWE